MTRRRIASLRERMQDQGLDALAVSSLHNIRYLTGFSGSNGLCVVTKGRAFLVTDTRYVAQSRMEVKNCNRVITRDGLYEAIPRHRMLRGCRAVGFESDYVTYAQYRLMKRVVSGVSFVPTRDLVEGISLVKEEGEVESIREAVRISDRVFDEIIKSLKPGVEELEMSAEISYLHKTLGAEKDAFEPIVASGERGSLPHARASRKKIRNREMVTLDFGCTVKGYNSDLTRTVGVGSASDRARQLHAVVLEAQAEAIELARSGMAARDLDAVARNRIAKAGFGKYFIHSLGHGLGLQVHERPRVSSLSKEVLVEGSVITIEPGVYIPHFGGVRIEDTCC